MKKIIIADGQIIHGYELNDLNVDTREKVIYEHGCFLCDVREPDEEDEDPQFPEESEIVESIEINGYLFDEYGEIIPIVEYTGKHPLSGSFGYGKNNTPCTIEPII